MAEQHRIGLATPDWAYIGAVLARAGDDEQAQFFKAFVAECNTWGTTYQVQSQLAFVNFKLTDDEKETLSMLSYKD